MAAFLEAVRAGNLARIRVLVERGEDVNHAMTGGRNRFILLQRMVTWMLLGFWWSGAQMSIPQRILERHRFLQLHGMVAWMLFGFWWSGAQMSIPQR